MKYRLSMMLILVICMAACLRSPTGTYQNLSFSSDTVIIEKGNDNEYLMIRGYTVPGSVDLRERKECIVKIDGHYMNYDGENFNAFSEDYETLTFKDGTFKKAD